MFPKLINDLGRHTAPLKADLEAAVNRVMERAYFILGPEVSGFEKEFGAYCGVPFCIGVANGTDGLELSLQALGLAPGDEVATVANAGGYSTTAILAAKCKPLYVDVEASSLNMDPAALELALTERTRCIIVTHLYGCMAEMPALMAVADKRGIPVIEDCAQAHGARLNGRLVGSWGKLGSFSFYPTKNLGALGDGGAVVTSDAKLAERIKYLRQYGWTSKYTRGIEGGRNSRLDEMQAAILRVMLPRLDDWNARRRTVAQCYNKCLTELGLDLPLVQDERSVAHLYVLQSGLRTKLKDGLTARGVGVDIHYPIPDHLQPSVTDPRPGSLPVTERACGRVLTLPCFPEMTELEAESVAEAVIRLVKCPE